MSEPERPPTTLGEVALPDVELRLTKLTSDDIISAAGHDPLPLAGYLSFDLDQLDYPSPRAYYHAPRKRLLLWAFAFVVFLTVETLLLSFFLDLPVTHMRFFLGICAVGNSILAAALIFQGLYRTNTFSSHRDRVAGHLVPFYSEDSDGAVSAGLPQFSLEERLAVGMRSRPLLPKTVGIEQELRAWMESQASREYDLVRIVCSFHPLPTERFHWARVKVELKGKTPGGPEPIVWSLAPKLVANDRQGTKTVKFGANLKLLEASTSSELPRAQVPVVRGWGELQREAEWNLRPSQHTLLGDYEFVVVTERAVGCDAALNIQVLAEIAWAGGRQTLKAALRADSSTIDLHAH